MGTSFTLPSHRLTDHLTYLSMKDVFHAWRLHWSLRSTLDALIIYHVQRGKLYPLRRPDKFLWCVRQWSERCGMCLKFNNWLPRVRFSVALPIVSSTLMFTLISIIALSSAGRVWDGTAKYELNRLCTNPNDAVGIVIRWCLPPVADLVVSAPMSTLPEGSSSVVTASPTPWDLVLRTLVIWLLWWSTFYATLMVVYIQSTFLPPGRHMQWNCKFCLLLLWQDLRSRNTQH